jgi:hypothetical protein
MMFITQKLCRSLGQVIAGSLTIPAIFSIAFAIGGLPIESSVAQPGKRPTVGKVTAMVNGDLMCYVNLTDDNNVKHKNIGASFDICTNRNTYLNRKVKVIYKQVNVNACQSADPCGKTRKEWLITKLEVLRSRTQ